jgi:hypothetical protein
MINCLVRSLRKRRPSIRAGLEALDTDTTLSLEPMPALVSDMNLYVSARSAAGCRRSADALSIKYICGCVGVTNVSFATVSKNGSKPLIT